MNGLKRVGALPWRVKEGELEVMLVTSRRRGRWILPKGKARRSEEPWMAAAREAAEEAGLHGQVSEFACGEYLTTSSKTFPQKYYIVTVYPLEVTSVVDKWPEDWFRRRMWVKAFEAGTVTNPEIARVINNFAASPEAVCALRGDRGIKA